MTFWGYFVKQCPRSNFGEILRRQILLFQMFRSAMFAGSEGKKMKKIEPKSEQSTCQLPREVDLVASKYKWQNTTIPRRTMALAHLRNVGVHAVTCVVPYFF